MANITRIAIDVMGGDVGPQVTIPAALKVASANQSVALVLVGPTQEVEPYLRSIAPDLSSRVSVTHASQVIAMHDKPSSALRSKKDSSIHVAMQLIKDGKAEAMVSAGNSGALMAIGRHLLKMLPGIDRPAMCAQVPTSEGHCYLLDLGANIEASSDNLYQYAVMGSVLASAVDRLAAPRVGLLNIGQEEIKGNERIKVAARMLDENSHINFVGYVEGDKIFSHSADVVVCDGFAGNVVLKASEGVARLIKEKLIGAFRGGWYKRLAGFVAIPMINNIRSQIDPGRLNGAILLGLQGSVVKSHGGADINSFATAINIAIAQANKGVPELIHRELEALEY